MNSVSIIIPCFNEEKNLPKLFAQLELFSKTHNMSFIFINDGSNDRSYELLKDFSIKDQNLYKVLTYPKNRGKGFAIRAGMLESKTSWVGFMDADLSVDLSQIDDILPLLSMDEDIIIGSRNLPQSDLKIPQNKFRKTLGKGFTIFANLITNLQISDFTCGFKFFSSTARDLVFKEAFVNRWAYDVELLYLARKYSLKIKEVPVIWKNGTDTKVNLLKDVLTSFLDTLRILFIHKFLK